MDWKNFGLSALAVYAVMLGAGTLISWISTFFQCKKTSVSDHFKQGSIYATPPTVVYALGRYFQFIRTPFVNVTKGYFPEVADIIGLGWLMVFSLALPATIWNIHQSEKAVCVPDVNEMALFKTKMLAELQIKEEEKAANAAKKP
jgi:hypothetical protein